MTTKADPANMILQDAIHTRRSVRGFTDTPVPQDIMDQIFTLAQRAPSNCNIQPWKVFVASGETRDILKDTMIKNITSGVVPNQDYEYPGKFEGEYRKRQVDCAFDMYNEMGIAREDKEGRMRASLRNFELFDAPHVAFIGMDKSFGATVALDVGMYIQTLMLVMTAHGIGSCAQGSMRSYPDLVRETFPGNQDIKILVGLSFGYEDTEVPANNTRIDRDDITASVTFKG
jgi:nitroreductase